MCVFRVTSDQYGLRVPSATPNFDMKNERTPEKQIRSKDIHNPTQLRGHDALIRPEVCE